ncbi:MAG: HD domain-containing protein [Phycisphaerae bacterium]
MARIAISQMRDGDVIEQSFILGNKALGTTNNSKLFIKAEASDATGSIHLRLWNASREHYERLPQTGYVIVRGRIESYQGHLQMVADGIEPCQDVSKIDLSELLKHTQKNVPEMLARVRAIMALIQDKELAALLGAFLDDAELMKKFSISPAAMGMHHAWIGGLLEHTLSLLELALLVCPRYPDIDQDLVLAGLLLHDIAKTAELSYTCGFDYTDLGRLVGHVALGTIWIETKAQQASAKLGKPIRKDLVMVLQHIVLSHHGVPEFGAAVLPKTPEAILVNLIDNLDAKTQMAIDAVAAPTEDNTWTEFSKAFGTKLYRPQITMKE